MDEGDGNSEMVLGGVCQKISEILLLCKDHPQCTERAAQSLMRIIAKFSADIPGQEEQETPDLKEVKKQVNQHLKLRRENGGVIEPDKQILKSILQVIAKRRGLPLEDKRLTKDAMFEWIHNNWSLDSFKNQLFGLIDSYGVPRPMVQDPKK